MKIEKVKYLIVGNSAGGIGAAEAIREVDKRSSLAIVSDEPYPAYSRPLISEYLANRCPLERMLFRPPDFYEKNAIHTYLDRRVKRLDVNEHTVYLEDGKRIAWKKLLLATGGLPILPKIKGVGLEGVFTFTTLDDAKAIDHYLEGAPRAVVIGGGLIGISVTEALVKRGVEVTIVEMKESILNTILDEEISALEAETLKRSGVSIITGHIVAEVGSNSSKGTAVSRVSLDNGNRIPCDMVIVAIGVQPRTKLAISTGIKVNRGIIVDRYMATSSPDVYACGDVAEAYDFVHGENRLTPIWPNAYLGGRIAGFNMASVPTEYQGGTAMNSLKYFGLVAVSAGMVTPPDGSYEVLSAKYNHTYKKVVLKDGLVMGMVFAGDIEKSGIVFSLMKDKVNVDGFKQALITDNFGLASLPEEIWRPRLEAPPSVLTSSADSCEQPEETVTGE
jgi:NAD(P)H-nitrite reductase large subunit